MSTPQADSQITIIALRVAIEALDECNLPELAEVIESLRESTEDFSMDMRQRRIAKLLLPAIKEYYDENK